MAQKDQKGGFVSRGGLKLQAALTQFHIDIHGLTVLDIGSSTGGFVDCLLQNGATKVYAVDTAYGELAWKLRNDPRVIVLERTNILHLRNRSYSSHSGKPTRLEDPVRAESAQILESQAPQNDNKVLVDLVTIDAGWTKLELVLPVVKKFLKPGGQIIALLKPHYQTDQKNLTRGVVADNLVESIKYRVLGEIEKMGFKVINNIKSPILGGGGNSEFLLQIQTA